MNCSQASHGYQAIRGWPGPSADGLGPRLAPNRWLGNLAHIKKRYQDGEIVASSVTFAVKGDEMARRILKDGVMLLGLHYRVERYLEARPDAMCGICCGWGHIEATCAYPTLPRCALCAAGHRTSEHKCDVVDCRAGKGQACTHVIAKCPNCRGPHRAESSSCPNCRGPHRAESSSCPKRQEAQARGRGWRGRAANGQPEEGEVEGRKEEKKKGKSKEQHLPEGVIATRGPGEGCRGIQEESRGKDLVEEEGEKGAGSYAAPPMELREAINPNFLGFPMNRAVRRHCPCHPFFRAGGPRGGFHPPDHRIYRTFG